jgi:hypothetical protein
MVDNSVRIKKLALILLALVASGYASAQGFREQFKDPLDGRFDASSFLVENAYGFLPVPIIITDPAVDGGLGVVGLFFHESEEQETQRLEALRESEEGARYLLPPSVSAVAGAYTGNDSWFAGGGHMGFFKQGTIRYMGGGGFGNVNLDFFGTGDIGFTRPVELNTQAGMFLNSLKFKLGKSRFFAGPTQRYVSARIEPVKLGDLDGSFLPPPLQPPWQDIMTRLMTQDVVLSALGAVVEFDSRDNFFSPHAGYEYSLEHLWYRDEIGSDVEYELLTISGHNYWALGERFRAGLRIAADYASTDGLLPPFATPGIVLRGIPAMRYQGNAVVVAEAEVTWQIDLRWSVKVFAGGGRVAMELDELGDQPSLVSKGGGFRYLIARRYGFEMGLDVARGPEETVFYIQAGTAWR